MFEDAEYIYIDDAHMYSDLKDFILNMNSYGKHVYIYGLDSDKNNNKIGQYGIQFHMHHQLRKFNNFE